MGFFCFKMISFIDYIDNMINLLFNYLIGLNF